MMDMLAVQCSLIGMFVGVSFIQGYGRMPSIRVMSPRRVVTGEERLLAHLFGGGYDPDARGVVNANKTVNVEVNFLLLRIQRLDERSQVLVSTGMIIADWYDERLVWHPRNYGGITDIVVKSERLWQPELAIINGADEMIPEFEKIRARVMYNGSVHWEPGGVFSTTCDIDIAFFPFDRQACPIHIGAWSYTSARMNLTNVTSSMEMQQFTVNGEWEVTSTNAEWQEIILQCCRDISYSKVVFTVYMKRRSAFYIVNIILPCCLLSVLILVVFCVPPDAGEKLSAGISVLLAFTVFLLMLADAVPRTSLDTPILVMYLSVTMISGTVSVCLTVIVLNIHHRGSHRPVPRCIHAIFFQCLGRCLGITHTNTKLRRLGSTKRQRNSDYMLNDPEQTGSIEIQSIIPGDSNNHVHNTFTLKERMPIGYGRRERHHSVTERCTRETMLEQQMEENGKDWRLLARIMDRVFFILVTMTMVLSAVLILSSPYYTDPGQKKTK